jgi:hypothetical protein
MPGFFLRVIRSESRRAPRPRLSSKRTGLEVRAPWHAIGSDGHPIGSDGHPIGSDRPGGSRTVARDRSEFARGPYKHASRRMARGPWILAQFPRSSSPLPAGANGQFLTNNDVKNDMGLTVIGFRPNG